MREVEFRQVDVFTATPFKGNPVAVVMDASGLSAAQMQSVARWTNLSETTFVLPPEGDRTHYRVRIFTPGGELPFAGHPTIGTAHALLEAGKISATGGAVVQECGAGDIQLKVEASDTGNIISFELPVPAITPLTEPEILRLESCLNTSVDRQLMPALVDVGARWIVARVPHAEAVLAVQPDFSRLKLHDQQMAVTGVCLFGDRDGTHRDSIEARSFAPACGVNEDPVCGSGNGSIAAFLRYHSSLPQTGRYTAYQGGMLGRDGVVSLQADNNAILVGGQAVTCVSGVIRLD